mmetsp:Transcript_6982/g.20407  ORF Transcript_6982/g.20407 Transcript_6982/m.20407 type:complete len:401 (+) Transcript_6982:1188-2390(+)
MRLLAQVLQRVALLRHGVGLRVDDGAEHRHGRCLQLHVLVLLRALLDRRGHGHGAAGAAGALECLEAGRLALAAHHLHAAGAAAIVQVDKSERVLRREAHGARPALDHDGLAHGLGTRSEELLHAHAVALEAPRRHRHGRERRLAFGVRSHVAGARRGQPRNGVGVGSFHAPRGRRREGIRRRRHHRLDAGLLTHERQVAPQVRRRLGSHSAHEGRARTLRGRHGVEDDNGERDVRHGEPGAGEEHGASEVPVQAPQHGAEVALREGRRVRRRALLLQQEARHLDVVPHEVQPLVHARLVDRAVAQQPRGRRRTAQRAHDRAAAAYVARRGTAALRHRQQHLGGERAELLELIKRLLRCRQVDTGRQRRGLHLGSHPAVLGVEELHGCCVGACPSPHQAC